TPSDLISLLGPRQLMLYRFTGSSGSARWAARARARVAGSIGWGGTISSKVGPRMGLAMRVLQKDFYAYEEKQIPLAHPTLRFGCASRKSPRNDTPVIVSE